MSENSNTHTVAIYLSPLPSHVSKHDKVRVQVLLPYLVSRSPDPFLHFRCCVIGSQAVQYIETTEPCIYKSIQRQLVT